VVYLPTVSTVTAGDPFSARTYNYELKASTDFLMSPPRAFVYQGTTAASFTTAVWKTLTFDTELFDSDSLHDPTTNPSRLTATAPGLYEILGQVNYGNIGGTGQRSIRFLKNGGQIAYASQPGISTAVNGVTQLVGVVALATNDYVELGFYQNSGATTSNVIGSSSTYFAMRWVDSL
jgi:hypothetical protein